MCTECDTCKYSKDVDGEVICDCKEVTCIPEQCCVVNYFDDCPHYEGSGEAEGCCCCLMLFLIVFIILLFLN